MKTDKFVNKDSEVLDFISDNPKPMTLFEKGRKAMKTKIFFAGLLIAVFCLISTGYSQVPQMMNYQGVLADSLGNRLNGNYNMTFSIYDTSNGGSPLWTQTQNGVSVEQGVFNVLLQVPDSVWSISQPEMNPRRYIGVSISSHPEMNPRSQIGSVPYAFHSGDWVVNGQNIYRPNGNVGIGTTSPAAKLEVTALNSTTNTNILRLGMTPEGYITTRYYVSGSAGVHRSQGWTFNFNPETSTKDYADMGALELGLTSYGAGFGNWPAGFYFNYMPRGITSTWSTAMFIDHEYGRVGIGTTSPQGALDVSSTTGAFIVPRMTTAQRDALTAVNGMIIYNTTTNQFNFRENGAWVIK